MKEVCRKVLLPVFTITEVCDASAPGAIKRAIKAQPSREALTYHVRPVIDSFDNTEQNYNLLPVVLSKCGAPWQLGALYILSRLEGVLRPNMTTYHSIADDLGVFKQWLDTHDDSDHLLFDFPKNRLRRTTYRYNGYLRKQIQAGEMAPSTANRRMSAVIAFYRWLKEEELFEPLYEPWEDRTYRLSAKTSYGASITKNVTSTNLSIKAPKTDDPFDGTINDGGKLRPLPESEQLWVIEAMGLLANQEMNLLILFMILTGARIQTATTVRLRHFTQSAPKFSRALSGGEEVFKLKIGPGTLIDTKNDKTMVLQVPRPLYDALRSYATSSRAVIRRRKANGGDQPDQYLFLTQQGNPYYQARTETEAYNSALTIRHYKNGGTIRKFFTDALLPLVRQRHDPYFFMRPHDLRATFGMNQTELQLRLVNEGVLTLSKARNNVKDLMGHESSETTDLYFDYKEQMETVYAALNGYGDRVKQLIDLAMNNGVVDGF